MNCHLPDAASVPPFPDAAVPGVWRDAASIPDEADLDADQLCRRVRRDGFIRIVEVFDAE